MPLACLFWPATAQGEAASPSAPAVSLRITAPQPLNGRGEWLPPDSEEGFLSTTLITCAAETEGSGQVGTIRWRATVFRGDHAVGTIDGTGATFTFRAADACRRQPSGPLTIEITAEVAPAPDDPVTDGEPPAKRDAGVLNARTVARVRIQQDEIDQIRQEYLDLPGRKLALVPRSAFIDRSTYEQQSTLGIPWSELNRTHRHDGGSYGHILLTDALREGLRRWQEQLGGRALSISSGFRNPLKQLSTNFRGGRDGAPGSMHQYGRAVDVSASLRRDFRDWVQVAWAALDAGADYVETAAEGGWSHVHADWRYDGQGPPLTVKLEIAGRVVDAEGNPIPTAHVMGSSDAVAGLPGMPAWEGPDAEGRFTLRTVWHPGRPYRLRASTEESAAEQAVAVPEGVAGLVRLESELVLTPDTLRAALARRRAVRLASRGGYRRSSLPKRRGRRG